MGLVVAMKDLPVEAAYAVWVGIGCVIGLTLTHGGEVEAILAVRRTR